MAKENRDKTLQIRVTSSEKKQIEALAAKKGVSVSRMLYENVKVMMHRSKRQPVSFRKLPDYLTD